MKPVYARLMLGVVIVARAALAQGYPCATAPGPSPTQVAPPTLPTLEAWVDPNFGNDATASTGGAGSPFKTIQAATTALAATIAWPAQNGAVLLMPGRYGYDPLDPRYNGEIWPVQVEPGVRIEGLNALNVLIDGGRRHPAAVSHNVVSPSSGALESAVPCFVLGSPRTSGYRWTLINRVTIVDADIGILVTGSGGVHPTIAESLFMNCRVGAQVHSSGGLSDGVHRPRFVWCTFGNCDIGLALTAETGGNPAPARALPAVVNGLFKCDTDLEGVPCSAVTTSAFAAARTNVSTSLIQPSEAPTPVFDADAYSHADLFMGARFLASGSPGSQAWFTDWRLTHQTATQPVTANPAANAGLIVFPIIPPNGTDVGAIFGDYAIGTASAEGSGTYGPLAGPTGTPTGHAGYRSGGTFLVGGTVPGERRFGLDAAGVMYDQVDLFWPPSGSAFFLGSVSIAQGPWLSGQRHPAGLLSGGVVLAPGSLPWAGSLFLDYQNHTIQDLSLLLPSNGTGGHHRISMGLPPVVQGWAGFAWQLAYLDGLGNLVTTDAQVFTVSE
jgi:hypothetical protein